MRIEEPRAIHLADYQAPAFRITTVHLDFALEPEATHVIAKLTIARQGAGALVLNGECQKLVSVALDGRGKIVSGPQVRALGLPTDEDYPLDDVLDDLADEAEQALARLKGEQRELDDEIETALSRAVKKASQRIWGRRPVVETTVLRI